jgi:hypothetical protein
MRKAVPPACLLLLLAAVAAAAASLAVTNTNDSGYGSLRRAVDLANGTSNRGAPDEIDFNIPGAGVHTIVLASALAEIVEPVVINGWSQPGWNGAPLIEVTAQRGTTMDGLTISAGSSTVRGLALNGFGKAIAISKNGNDTIQGCYIGIDKTGMIAAPNDFGIFSDSTSNNLIGGTRPEARNVISGNRGTGVVLNDPTSSDPNTTGHVIQGNYVGTDVTGTHSLPNVGYGMQVWCRNAVIGGAAPGAGNLVSGNRGDGIWEYGSHAVIVGNIVGTDASGSSALPNGGFGISMQSLAGQIGGPGAGEGNLVSGNRRISRSLSSSSSTDSPQAGGIIVASYGAVIQGNRIGTASGACPTKARVLPWPEKTSSADLFPPPGI